MDLIPITKGIPDLSQSQTLDGTEYIIHVQWNMRGGWFFALHDANDDVIFTPRRMTVGSDLFAGNHHDARVPAGQLLVVDFSKTDVEPAYLDLVSGTSETDLQGRVALVYVPVDDPDVGA